MANDEFDFSGVEALLAEIDGPPAGSASPPVRTPPATPPAAPAVTAPPAAPPTPAAPPEPEPVEIQPLTTGGDGGLVSGSVLDMAADKAKAGKAAQPERPTVTKAATTLGTDNILSEIRDYATGHPDSERLSFASALQDLERPLRIRPGSGFVGPVTPEMTELADMRRTMQAYQSVGEHLQRTGSRFGKDLGETQSGESSAAEQRLREMLPEARAQLANQMRDYVEANRSNLPMRQIAQEPSKRSAFGAAQLAAPSLIAGAGAAMSGLAGRALPAAASTVLSAAQQAREKISGTQARRTEPQSIERAQRGLEVSPLRRSASQPDSPAAAAQASGASGVPEGIPTGYAQIGVDKAEAGTPDYDARWYREPGTTNFYVVREGQAPEKIDASNVNLLKMLENIRLLDGVGGA